jgi:hypothetical protein
MNSKLIGLAVRATFFETATLLGGVSQASAGGSQSQHPVISENPRLRLIA